MATSKKKKVTKVDPSPLLKPTGDVEVKVRTFRDKPVLHGKIFFSTGRLKHPGTLIVPAAEAERRAELVEVIGEVQETEELVEEPVHGLSDEEFSE